MAPPGDAVGVGVKAGLSIIESSLLGSFAVLCLSMAIVSIWLAFKTQNARVADQKQMVDKMEGLIKEQGQFNTTTSAAITKLNENEQAQITLLTGMSTQLQTIVAGLMRG